jgi:hypothetical protein
MLAGSGEPPQTRRLRCPRNEANPRTGDTRSNGTFQQLLSGSRRRVPSASMNSTSTPAAAPAGRRPATKHLTIDPDHSVPQLNGSTPPNALGALAMPQLLWHRTAICDENLHTFLVSDLDRLFCHPGIMISGRITPMHH